MAHLRRILEMVPYLAANPGVHVDEVCEAFGTDRESLVRDLELLWVCGLPPYGPGDLFDVAFKANLRNVALLADTLGRGASPRDPTAVLRLATILIAVTITCLVIASSAITIVLIRALLR